MASHWFGYSQWQLPNESDYLKLQELFHRVAGEKFSTNPLNRSHSDLIDTQATLNREYHELAAKY